MLSSIPEKMGRAARATIGDLVYAVLFNNPDLNDGYPLFDEWHGYYVSGSLATDTLSDAKALMRRQKSADGQTLNILPKYLIVPAIQESMALQVIRSTSVPGSENNSGVYNPQKDAMEIIVEPRLDDVSEDEYVFNISEIARMLHCHRQTITKIILDHKIESKGMRKTYKLYSVADVAESKFNRRNWW